MTLNVFRIKRLVSYYIPPLVVLGAFIVSIIAGFGLLISIAVSIVLMLFLSFLMYRWTKHPVIASLEGDGIWTLVLDSKGVLRSYLARIKPEGDTVKLVLPNGKELLFKRDELTYIQFGSDIGIPVILYNEVLGMPITKEDLKDKEKLYLEHVALEVLHKTTELSHYMRDFARYIIEQMKPSRKLFDVGSLKWIIILFIIGIIIFMILQTGFGGNIVSSGVKAVGNLTAKATIP